MTKKDYEYGIEEYTKKHDEKMHSPEVKELHSKYIQPILDKSSKMYKAENKKASWTGSFFQGDKILARAGIRKNGLYREEEKIYLTKDIILELV